MQERYLDPIEELVFQSSSVFEEMEKETVNEMQRSIIAEVATTLTALEEEVMTFPVQKSLFQLPITLLTVWGGIYD